MTLDPSDYETVNTIGTGYFAIVRRCRHKLSGAELAIKQLRKENRNNPNHQARLRREIEILRRLADVDEVIPLMACSARVDGPDACYAMPVADYNLQEFIKRHNAQLDDSERLQIVERIMRAMEAAHDRGILHRDLSPSNVLILRADDLETTVVSDFGLGKRVDSDSGTTGTSARDYGHAFYVAPEQRSSLKEASVRSDVYSLGKLLTFVMTGKDPDYNHPSPFLSVVKRATEHDVEMRHPSVAHFAEHVRQIASLLLEPEGPPGGSTALIIQECSAGPPDWNRLYAALTTPRYEGHVFYGYVDPVVSFFAERGRLAAFYKAIGADIGAFVERFIELMHECMRTVGWPFRRTDSFADLLRDVFDTVKESEIRANCLTGIWDIAYGADQWGPQRDLKGLLFSGSVTQAEALVLAEHIMNERTAVRDEDLLDPRIPGPIRVAIRKVRGAGAENVDTE